MKKYAIEFLSDITAESSGQLLKCLGEIQDTKEDSDLLLLISSTGGDNGWCSALISAFQRLPKRINVDTFACGPVFSASTSLYCVGQKRMAMPLSRFIFHHASMNNDKTHVNTSRACEMSNRLVSDDSWHAEYISERTGWKRDEIMYAISSGFVISVSKAIELKIVNDETAFQPDLLNDRTIWRILPKYSSEPEKRDCAVPSPSHF